MRTYVASVGALLFFALVALSGRSLLLVLGLFGLVLLLGVAERPLTRAELLRALWSPHLPFIIVVAAIAPFPEKATDGFWLLSISASFVLARLIRLRVEVQHLVWGVVVLGFVLGGVFVLGRSEIGELVPPLEGLSNYLDKNIFGWIAALGLVAVPSLWVRYVDRPFRRWLLAVFAGGFAVVLFFTGSMTGFLGAGITLTVIAIVEFFSALRNGRLRSLWQSQILFMMIGLGVLAVFTLLNNLSSAPRELTLVAARDSSLSSRTDVWACFLEGVLQPGANVEMVRRECVGFQISNLHNSFLEAFSTGGVLLAATLLFGFVAGIVHKALAAFSALKTNSHRARQVLFLLWRFLVSLLPWWSLSSFPVMFIRASCCF